MPTTTQVTELPISVRAYAQQAKSEAKYPRTRKRTALGHSAYTLIFDTETTTDPAQALRLGGYQVQKAETLIASGFFFDPCILTDNEQAVLQATAQQRGMTCMPVTEFIHEVFFPYVFDLAAMCVGFNLPFDLSRIALHADTARGKLMHGGFTFILSENKQYPRIQIKHLDSRRAQIQLTKPGKQFTPRGMRRRGLKVEPHRGTLSMSARSPVRCFPGHGHWVHWHNTWPCHTPNYRLKRMGGY